MPVATPLGLEALISLMADHATEEGSEADQLRTVAFRMREIQRLLAARVEQENRRLEAEGLEPVDEARFLSEADRQT